MSKIHYFSGGMFCHTQLNASTSVKVLRLSITINLQKMKEDNISQLDDHDAPFCEQQYMHGSCYMSLFNSNHLISLIPPKLPQILDIYSVVALYIVFIIIFNSTMHYHKLHSSTQDKHTCHN